LAGGDALPGAGRGALPLAGGGAPPGAADPRAAKKELARLERQVARLEQREAQLHDELVIHATDYEKVTALDTELRAVRADRAQVEDAWLTLAYRIGDAG
jgi:FixJ family two-component response regulator